MPKSVLFDRALYAKSIYILKTFIIENITTLGKYFMKNNENCRLLQTNMLNYSCVA